MSAWGRNILLALTALIVLGTGYLVFQGQQARDRITAKDAGAVEELLSLSLEDAGGGRQALRQWQGRLLVVNFWATWCPPCLKEMPGFSRLQGRLSGKGVQFVGIGIDSADKIREFARTVPISYPLLVAPADTLNLARKFGNHSDGLPYTVVLDPKGRVLATRLGAWSETDLEKFLAESPR